MIITIETTFTSHHATRALLLPLIVKHCIADLLQPFLFGDPRLIRQCDWLLSVLHDCSSFCYRFFLRRW